MVYQRPGVDTIKQQALTSNIADETSVNIGVIAISEGGRSEESLDVIRVSGTMNDFISNNMAKANCFYKGYAYAEGIDYDVNNGEIQWRQSTISVPFIKEIKKEEAVNKLMAGTYFYKVTALKRTVAGDPPTFGETTASNEVTIQLATDSAVRLEWVKVAQAEGYRIYRSSTTGTEERLAEVLGEATTWLDEGTMTPVPTATVPVLNTAYRKPPTSIADTQGNNVSPDSGASHSTVANGSISISLDGGTNIDVTGIDFSTDTNFNANALTLQTALQTACGTKGMFNSGDISINLNILKTVTNGVFEIETDGAVAIPVTSVDFSGATDMNDVAIILQNSIQTATGRQETVTYDDESGVLTIFSPSTGTGSSIAVNAILGGDDLTEARYCDFLHGYSVDGNNSEISVVYTVGGTNGYFTVTSPTFGSESDVLLSSVTPTTGTDIFVTAPFNFSAGIRTAGADGEKTLYSVEATMLGNNFFRPSVIFSLSEIEKHYGRESVMYEVGAKMLQSPPNGNGGKQLTCCGVPNMERATVQAALSEMEKYNMDFILAYTDNIDVGRDVFYHAEAMSTVSKKKERIAGVFLKKTLKLEQIVSLANEMRSDRMALIWDNASTEQNIVPIVFARVASKADVATSTINTALIVEGTAEPIFEEGALTYLGGNNVLVCDFNQNRVYTVIDDLLTSGTDIVGTLSDDRLRKGLRKEFTKYNGIMKLTDSALTAIKVGLRQFLTVKKADRIINDFDEASISVERDITKKHKAICIFTYQRIHTLKNIEFRYFVD